MAAEGVVQPGPSRGVVGRGVFGVNDHDAAHVELALAFTTLVWLVSLAWMFRIFASSFLAADMSSFGAAETLPALASSKAFRAFLIETSFFPEGSQILLPSNLQT
mgnify:CR=1 FL=1